MALKIFAGLYLIWLAFLSAKSALHSDNEKNQLEIGTRSQMGWFIKGVFLNVSNPKTVIAWMAALSVGLGANDSTTFLMLGVLVCILVGFFTNALYSIVFSFNGVMNGYKKASRWIDGAVSGLFTLAGIGLIRSALIKQV